MQIIDLDNWLRKKHFEFFNSMDYPHFNVCARVDVTIAKHWIHENDLSIFKSMLYFIVRAANHIDALRMRIRGTSVVLHEHVHPSFTVLADNEIFGFAYTDYSEDFKKFYSSTDVAIKHAKENISLKDEPGRDDYLFLSCLPWINFTSISHPIHLNPVDSVPRLTWGKITEEGTRITMPISVQAHHAVVDGMHIGQFFNHLQGLLDQPAIIFS